MRVRFALVAGFSLALPSAALAQAPAPPNSPSQYPPSPYPPPPPQQTYPAPSYPPPQGYPPPACPPPPAYPPPAPPYPAQPAYPSGYPPPPAYPPPARPDYGPSPYGGYQAPAELPYRQGQPIPNGYRLVEGPRWGLVTGGYLLAGIPYGLGLVAAAGANFDNGTEWLALPFVGPWLTMGRRDYHCESSNGSTENGADCLADVFVVMGLIVDGALQAGGGAMLLAGYLSTKKTLVREDLALTVRPVVSSSAWGLTAAGRF